MTQTTMTPTVEPVTPSAEPAAAVRLLVVQAELMRAQAAVDARIEPVVARPALRDLSPLGR
jgi:hypothetical protein